MLCKSIGWFLYDGNFLKKTKIAKAGDCGYFCLENLNILVYSQIKIKQYINETAISVIVQSVIGYFNCFIYLLLNSSVFSTENMLFYVAFRDYEDFIPYGDRYFANMHNQQNACSFGCQFATMLVELNCND